MPRGKKFTAEQIIGKLDEARTGQRSRRCAQGMVCTRHGLPDTAVFRTRHRGQARARLGSSNIGDEVMPCVVLRDGDTWTIDETHPAYPRRPPAGERPGTVLATLLARVGITGAHGCQCRVRAREMDRRGCRWCERNIDTIVGWLGEEAGRRGLPFVEVAARMLVRRAIRTARREANPN